MSHLNVLLPSNMNHEYMHPGVGQRSLLEYITTVPGDHFVHPSKMYHISAAERETWLHVSCDVSIITIHEIQTLMAGPLIWTISRWGEIYSGVKGDHTIKGLGRKTVSDNWSARSLCFRAAINISVRRSRVNLANISFRIKEGVVELWRFSSQNVTPASAPSTYKALNFAWGPERMATGTL